MRTQSNAVGDGMTEQFVQGGVVRRVQAEVAALQIPHQQPLPFQVASDALTDPKTTRRTERSPSVRSRRARACCSPNCPQLMRATRRQSLRLC